MIDAFPWYPFFSNNFFYETHSILHVNWKWESELKSDIPDLRTDCNYLTIISHLSCVFVILMQKKKYFQKRKVTKFDSNHFENGTNLGVFGMR